MKPTYGSAHQWYAYYLAARRTLPEALAEIERARAAEPVSLIINTDVAHILVYARRYDEAVEKLREVLRLDPNFVQAHSLLAEIYLRQGKTDEAAAETQSIAPFLTPDGLGRIEAARGNREAARAALALLEADYRNGRPLANAFRIARLNAEMGRRQESLRWLEVSFRQRDGDLAMIIVDPAFDSLRSDGSFQAFLSRTRLGR